MPHPNAMAVKLHRRAAIGAGVAHCVAPRVCGGIMRYVVLAGRVLSASIFVMASFGHFSQQAVAYAASQGVPLAALAVPLSGILALAGGLSVLVGYRARIGAALLVLFLVPVT